jgi:hypothetical protein
MMMISILSLRIPPLPLLPQNLSQKLRKRRRKKSQLLNRLSSSTLRSTKKDLILMVFGKKLKRKLLWMVLSGTNTLKRSPLWGRSKNSKSDVSLKMIRLLLTISSIRSLLGMMMSNQLTSSASTNSDHS